jgi:hypothetical protein
MILYFPMVARRLVPTDDAGALAFAEVANVQSRDADRRI